MIIICPFFFSGKASACKATNVMQAHIATIIFLNFRPRSFKAAHSVLMILHGSGAVGWLQGTRRLRRGNLSGRRCRRR